MFWKKTELYTLITAEITRISDQYVTALSLRGHAKLAPKGQDILCAAVSILLENLGHSLKTLLHIPVKIKAEKGLYTITMRQDNVSEGSQLLFESVVLGLEVLSTQYPKQLELKEIIHGT